MRLYEKIKKVVDIFFFCLMYYVWQKIIIISKNYIMYLVKLFPIVLVFSFLIYSASVNADDGTLHQNAICVNVQLSDCSTNNNCVLSHTCGGCSGCGATCTQSWLLPNVPSVGGVCEGGHNPGNYCCGCYQIVARGKTGSLTCASYLTQCDGDPELEDYCTTPIGSCNNNCNSGEVDMCAGWACNWGGCTCS